MLTITAQHWADPSGRVNDHMGSDPAGRPRRRAAAKPGYLRRIRPSAGAVHNGGVVVIVVFTSSGGRVVLLLVGWQRRSPHSLCAPQPQQPQESLPPCGIFTTGRGSETGCTAQEMMPTLFTYVAAQHSYTTQHTLHSRAAIGCTASDRLHIEFRVLRAVRHRHVTRGCSRAAAKQ